ncbi:hypothetical protein Ae201684P_009341 [Aphanomyces euteiches]|nr:hypothetical protein Ae201684P_009341 [Aphanomyces euteiches]KAH9133697.1 hypothetical protein AeRB84_020290 [Aphanomyces euteiches]
MLRLCGVASMKAIAKKSGVNTTCGAFIDGTVRPICRPTRFQRQAYNGHKRVHSLKFQSVTLANGLIMAMHGPIEGRRHDIILLRSSNIGNKWTTIAPEDMYIYGDPAYPLRKWLLSPYKGSRLSPAQVKFNSKMSSVRVSVEWCFGDILRYWAFLDFKKNLKVFLSPVAKMYLMGVLFTNCLSCVRCGNQASRFFELDPPCLEDYLG